MSPAAPHTAPHLSIHEDVKANPKHLEEVPAVGPILHEMLGKPWGRGEVAGGVTEKRLRAGVPRAPEMQGPLQVHEDSPMPLNVV